MNPHSFFVDLIMKIASPKSLAGIFVGLAIGVVTVWFSGDVLCRLPLYIQNSECLYDSASNTAEVLGGMAVGLYGYYFAGNVSHRSRFLAALLFSILGWISLDGGRLIVENLFGWDHLARANNFKSYAISCGFACFLASAVLETLTQPQGAKASPEK